MFFRAIVPVLCETGGPEMKKSTYTQETTEIIQGKQNQGKFRGKKQ